MANTELKIKDFLAIRKPIFFHNPVICSFPSNISEVAFLIGIPTGNQIDDIYGKGNKMVCMQRHFIELTYRFTHCTYPAQTDWRKVSEISTKLRSLSTSAKGKLKVTFKTNERRTTDMRSNIRYTSSEEEDDDGEIMDTPDSLRSPRSCTSPNTNNVASTSIESDGETFREAGSTASRVLLNNLRIRDPTSPLNTENVRLRDVREDMKVTVFGVILSDGKVSFLQKSFHSRCRKLSGNISRFSEFENRR